MNVQGLTRVSLPMLMSQNRAKLSKISFDRSILIGWGAATLGPIAGSITQFLLSVQMMHALSPSRFGEFAFFLVVFQFLIGVSNAIFCAPLPIFIEEGGDDSHGINLRALFAVNLVFCAMGAVFIFVFGLTTGLGGLAAVLFGLYTGLALFRWFARAYGYAVGAASRTIASDLIYSTALAVFIIIIFVKNSVNINDALVALLASVVFGLTPFWRSGLRKKFGKLGIYDIMRYRFIWSSHTRWSFIGVITTETTTNAHAYIVTAIAGATAFAPLAATALLVRPIGVLMSALGEYERPRLSRALAGDDGVHALRNSSILIWITLGLGWVGSIAMVVILLSIAPHLFFSRNYTTMELNIGAVLWLIVVGVKCWRAPESIFLQATGRFRELAHASLISCWVSMLCVAITLFLAGPFGSLVGVIIGEIVFAFCISRHARIWEKFRSINS